MTGIIISLPPNVEVPPGNNASNPSSLPPVTYQYALTTIPQTWTAKQTFPLGNISVQAADVAGYVDPTNASNITSGILADARTQYLSGSSGAVARTVNNKLGDFVTLADFGALPSASAATNNTKIQAALTAGGYIFVPPGVYSFSATQSISQGNTHLWGPGRGLSIFSSSSTNTTMFSIAANLGNIIIENLGFTRSVTATSGAVGVFCNGFLDTSRISNCEMQKQHVGWFLSSTGSSEFSGNYTHDCIFDGLEYGNTAGNGAVQWNFSNNLYTFNGGRGRILIAASGPAGVTVGDSINERTFANSSFGIAAVGLPGTPIQGFRMQGGFIGSDGNSPIYLDTYGGLINLDGVYTERAGRDPTGPGAGTAASGIGNGVEITPNNLDVKITSLKANSHSQSGLKSSASVATMVGDSEFQNNAGFGTLFADGAKATLNDSLFVSNGSGNVSCTSNASSLFPRGCFPASLNKISVAELPTIPLATNAAARAGSFDVWQRLVNGATGISVAASTTAYTNDGWYLATAASQASTVTRATGVAVGSLYAAKVQRNSGQTGTGVIRYAMPLDSDEISQLVGSNVALSFTMKEGANQSFSHTVNAVLYCGTGAVAKRNGSAFTGETTPISLTVTTSTTGTRFQATSAAVIPANTTQMEIQFNITPSGTAGADDSFTVDDLLLEAVASSSSAASSFVKIPVQQQLEMCQRFLPVFNSPGAGNGYFAMAECLSTTAAAGIFAFPVTTRVPVTAIVASAFSDFGAANNAGSPQTATSIAVAGVPTQYGSVVSMAVASGLLQGNASFLASITAAGQLLFTGAEI